MKRKLIIMAALLLSLSSLSAKSLVVRAESSVGYMPVFDYGSCVAQNYGAKVLFGITEKQRFGLKLDYVHFGSDDFLPFVKGNYMSVGIVLEQVLFKYFNMGIGTVGYIGMDDLLSNPFSIYTHLGFEYEFKNNIMLLAAYQADFMFFDNFALNNAFRVGIGYKFNL